jgi:DNA-binding GntR family transcriptional regulator
MSENKILSGRIKTKNELAYETLRLGIIRGEYKPGEKLVIRLIAEGFGISSIPVREALKTLEAEGLVRNTPHVGFVVTEPDFTDKDQVLEIRQLLEGHATWLAASRMPPEALEDLKRLVAEMKDNTSQETRLADLNYQFHNLIYSFCGNAILYKLIQQVRAMAPRTISIYSLMKDRIQSAIQEHDDIYSYLKERNAEGAKQALLAHQQKSYDLLIQYKT